MESNLYSNLGYSIGVFRALQGIILAMFGALNLPTAF